MEQADNGVLVVSSTSLNDDYQFDKVLRLVGEKKERFGVVCPPPGGVWTSANATNFVSNLTAAVQRHRPRLILSLGDTARSLLGLTNTLDNCRGYIQAAPFRQSVQDSLRLPTNSQLPTLTTLPALTITPSLSDADASASPSQSIRSTPLTPLLKLSLNTPASSMSSITPANEHATESHALPAILATYSPTGLVVGLQGLMGIVAWDIGRAVEVARMGYTPDPEHYSEHPGYDEVVAYRNAVEAQPEVMLAADIETAGFDKEQAEEDESDTPPGYITCISFSLRDHEAITIPWQPPYLELCKQILALPNTKVFWNGIKYDVPMLTGHGAVIGGRVYDAMWGWKFLQGGLPKSVKPNRLSFVAPHYCNTEPWKHLSSLQPEYYSCKDAAVTRRIGLGLQRTLLQKGMWSSFIRDRVELVPLLHKMGRTGLPVDGEAQAALAVRLEAEQGDELKLVQAEVPDALKKVIIKKGKPKKDLELYEEFEREDGKKGWRRLEDFKPRSAPQLIAYMEAMGYPVPRNTKTGKPTTGEKGLRRLAMRYNDPVLKAVLGFKESSKVSSTYLWPIESDGRVRTHYDFTYTSRLRSYRHNLQNVPKRKAHLAKLLRATVRPPDGWCFVEADLSSAEPLMTGFFADDPQYMQIATHGAHVFFASHMLGEPLALDMSGLEEGVREARRRAETTMAPGTSIAVYDVAKTTLMGISYGMGKGLMHKENPEVFESEAVAERYRRMYFDTIGRKVKVWQDKVVMEAHRRHCLRNPFHHLMWFWNVLVWDGRYKTWRLGTDAKAAIAALPQSSIGVKVCRDIVGLREVVEAGWLPLQIHDALFACCPLSERDWVAKRMAEQMTAPVPELAGLSFGVEVKVGERSWAEMETYCKVKPVLPSSPLLSKGEGSPLEGGAVTSG